MEAEYISILYFIYGLSFFSMGLAIILEIGRGSDPRLRHALHYLAIFGLMHGAHEWLEMFQGIRLLPGTPSGDVLWDSLRLAVLSLSFLSLTAFGASLLAPTEKARRLSLLAPLGQAAVWGFGLLILRGIYTMNTGLWDVADVWSRYTLGVPSALVACAGLVVQQRNFRRAGMARFGRDSLWAAVAFAWYGAVGQVFVRSSPLMPSTVVNQDLFLALVGFPVEILRGAAALVAAVFVIRFLRSFEVEIQKQIGELQSSRLHEARRREALRGELLKRIVAAQEAERQRIARELHDETGQALTAIGLGLRGVARSVPADADKSKHNLEHLGDLVEQSLNELQRLIADLRPFHLDDLGLPAALRWYATDVQSRAQLTVKVELEGEPRKIPAPVNTALFRVAQEALTNIIKHAFAEQARVVLRFEERVVSLRVEDNGCGFDIATLQNPDRPSWGLLGMQERASLLGGKLRLESRLGKGTVVEVTIPYDQEKAGSHEDTLSLGG